MLRVLQRSKQQIPNIKYRYLSSYLARDWGNPDSKMAGLQNVLLGMGKFIPTHETARISAH